MTETDDRAQLLRYIDGLAENGRRIPCHDGTLTDTAIWTDDEPAHQELAARKCLPCPAIDACRSFGLANRDEVGVYGGLTDTERRPKVGRPKKEAAA